MEGREEEDFRRVSARDLVRVASAGGMKECSVRGVRGLAGIGATREINTRNGTERNGTEREIGAGEREERSA